MATTMFNCAYLMRLNDDLYYGCRIEFSVNADAAVQAVREYLMHNYPSAHHIDINAYEITQQLEAVVARHYVRRFVMSELNG